ncbi:MAG: hypothetical protein Q8K50_06965, partial [Hydrogenophaga sp.]|nr:hypothetical protein [Hydrogenophaga sp.]
MAMLDRIQELFKKKTGNEPDLSGTTDQEVASLATVRLAPNLSDDDFAASRMADDEDFPVQTDLVAVPLLGRKPAE